MGFVMDGLDPEPYDRAYTDRQLVRRISSYFRDKLPLMGLVAGIIVLNSIMDTVLPILISGGIDTLAKGRDMAGAGLLIGGILVAGALSWAFNYGRQWLTAQAVGDVVLKLRTDVFAGVLGRDLSFYDEYRSGKIVSRVTGDTEDFSNVVTLTLNLMSQSLLLVILTGVLLVINTRLTLLALIIAPLILACALGFRRIARLTIQHSRRAGATVNAAVQEAMSGITVAKNFRQEGRIYGEFRGVNAQAYAMNLRSGFVFSAIFPLLVTVAGLGTTVVVYFGGNDVLDGHVSAGQWFLFIQAISLFWFPLTSLASFWSQFQQGLAAGERVFALITAETRRCGGDVADGLLAAISWIGRHLPVYSINLVLATATDLWALRYPATNELYVLARPAGRTGTGGRLDLRGSRLRASAGDLATRPAVVVASEKMNNDRGWRPLDPGELLHIASYLTVTSSTVFPDGPDHVLTLQDLDPPAASSQAAGGV